MMTYFTKVFGCQMNYSDAERIATMLEKYKIQSAASIDEADLIVFVTCGVRQSAEDRVYGQVNNIRKKYLEKKIVLTGCLAHRKDVQRRLKGKVDLFTTIKDFPISASPFIKRGSRGILKNEKNPSPAEKRAGIDYLKIKPKYSDTYSAYIPVMTGCDNFCTYCVVPYARGREYSRPAKDIIREIKNLLKNGYKEIILLGQNVNSYKSKSIGFPKLLQDIEKIKGNFWLTFLTSHPKDMSDELIETIAKSKKICEYISLPAQSGDNKILARMNRKYTIEHYKKLIRKIRKAFVDVRRLRNLSLPAISTDIIVGFPGETRKQFEKTAKLMKEMKYDMAYIAQYSPRPETAALKIKDDVSKTEKKRREKVLTEILAKTALANNKKYIGKTVEVLVDKSLSNSPFTKGREPIAPPLKKGEEEGDFKKFKYLSHTRTQKKVIFVSKKKISAGSFQKVKIVKAKPFGLEGEKV